MGTPCSDPNILGSTPKIKILLLISIMRTGTNKCQVPVGQKLREEIDFQETDHLWPRVISWGVDDFRPLPPPQKKERNYL